MFQFAHLRVHSCYSLGWGPSSPDRLLEQAAGLGYDRIALTDRNGLYGAVGFYQKAKALGLTPILGAEVDDPAEPRHRAVVLAADREGFSDLCRLVTRRHLEETFSLPVALSEVGPGCRILADGEDLLARLAAGPARRILSGEISPRLLAGGGAGARRLESVAARLGIPVAATGDVYFAEPAEHRLHKILRAITLGATLDGLPSAETVGPDRYLAGAGEMAERFKYFPQAVRHAGRLAGECRLELDVGKWKYPAAPLTPGETPFSRLWKLAVAGLESRYKPIPLEAAKRLIQELEVIEHGGFAGYFLLVYDILDQARLWGLRHVGRGSAANSIVSYCLGFTAVDPLALNLYFERFMNPARTSPPDIDIDFSWRERPRVLDYVYRRYGSDRVAMIGTHVTFGPRAAMREVARCHGLSPGEIRAVTRHVPHWGVAVLADLKATVPECRDLPLGEEPWAGITAQAQGLLGLPRYLSVHPGGIIVAPEPLRRWCPLQKAAGGMVVTQYDMHGVEAIGLIKIDLLSQRSLGVLEDALADLKAAGTEPPLENLSRVTADEGTRDLVRRGKTMGCFYIESPAMRSLLQKLGTDTFEGLTAASSVIRPGVAESGMMQAYIERHRHPAKRESAHPLLRQVLGETYGVMIYQEDVLRVAHQVAGLTLAEADLLRRSMSGKMRSREAMAELKERFVAAAIDRGAAPAVAAELWRQIASFAGYAFCKAHSASYAVLSFQLAYLKAHYPDVFMAAVLSNGGGYYGAAAYIEECRRLGVPVLAADVNRSLIRYSAESGGVRVGLMAVKDLSRPAMESLLKTRLADGPFASVSDMVCRAALSSREAENLVFCGACDSLGPSRPHLLWELLGAGDGNRPGPRLCPGGQSRLPPLHDYTPAEKCAMETDILGFSPRHHPLAIYRQAVPADAVPAADLAAWSGRRVRMVGWPVAYKRVTTKRGEVMKFLSLEDLTGTFEAVFFPRAYRRCAKATVAGGPLLLGGRVAEDGGVYSLTAEEAAVLGHPDGVLTAFWR